MANLKLSQIVTGNPVSFTTDFLVAVQGNNTLDTKITPAQLVASFPPQPVVVRSSNGATITVLTTDYFLALDPTSNAITVNLPSSPLIGMTFIIKDVTGQAATHNITITPASGNIDGAATLVLNANFASTTVTYTGTRWSVN